MRKLLFPPLIVVGLLGILLFMNSCGVLNPNIMLHAGKKYQYDTLEKDTTIAKEFRLGPNDIIELRLFANDGFKMIDIIASGNTNNAIFRQSFEYTLDKDGVVKLPVLGEESLNGMTIREAEAHLEKRYSEFYVNPFVMIKINNKRITIFPGEPGQAKVITLQNNNTTVLEALALAGGISADGKAYNIKLIRQNEDAKKPVKVYKLDLSKIENIEQGNTVVQSGDIIYVEPRRQLASKALREITPILALTSSLLTFYILLSRL